MPLNRRRFLQTVAAATGGAAVGHRARAAGPGRPRNVLFIAADDLRPQLGCYGDPVVQSPHLDALAARGRLFERAYCQQSVCCPSRSSLMTGRRPDSIRVWDLQTYFRHTVPEVVTLPQAFKNRGYFTQDIGKIYHNDTRPLSAGPRMYDLASWSVPPVHADGEHWRDWVVPGQPGGPKTKQGAYQCLAVPDNAYTDGQIADQAVASLQRLAGQEQPFFLAVGFWKPHLPFNPPKKYWDLYAPGSIPPPANPCPPRGAPAIALHHSTELRNYAGIPQQGPIPPELSATLRHGYYAGISFLDHNVGRLLGELRRLGLEDNTVVVFWVDHGLHLGEHELWGKTSDYELDTHVPLIIAAPGMVRPGAKAAGLVELLDIYPTLLELCGLPPDAGLEGRSVAPLLDDPDHPGKESVLSQHQHPFYAPHATAMGYSLRTDRYRYVEWRTMARLGLAGQELYDYQADPRETVNRAGDPNLAPLLRALRQQMRERMPAAAVPG